MKLIASIRLLLLGWASLTAAWLVATLLLPSGRPLSTESFVASLTPNLLIAGVLWYAAVRSGWKGLRLGVALFVIPVSLHFVNTVEAVLFLGDAAANEPGSIFNVLITYGAVAPVWVLLFVNRHDVRAHTPLSFAPGSPVGWIWRVVSSDFLYVFLYLVAGMIIFPLVQEFYATQTLPSLGKIVASGFLVRGPGYLGVCLLLLRMMHLEGWSAAIGVGTAFSILSGIAPLVAPNPYMPDSVRWVHFFEVSISNLLFGAFVGWIWSRKRLVAGLVPSEAH